MKHSITTASYISSLWIAGISLLLLMAINVSWLRQSDHFSVPPEVDTEGQTIEAIGWGLYSGLGFATHFADPDWRAAYIGSHPDSHPSRFIKTGPIVPRTDYSPILPMVIAGIYHVFGVTPSAFAAVRTFLAFCLAVAGALSVFLAHRYAQWIMQHRSFESLSNHAKQNLALFCAIVCFAVFAFDHRVRAYTEDFATNLPALVSTQLLIFASLFALRRTGISAYITLGIAFGLMVYASPSSVVLVPGLFWCWLILGRDATDDLQSTSWTGNWCLRRILRAFTPIVVAVVVVAPWCLRNSIILHQFKPFGTAAPITLMGGYCDTAYEQSGSWSYEPEAYWRGILEQSFGDELARSSDANLLLELELAAIAKREVWQWIVMNKAKLPNMAFKRFSSLYRSPTSLNLWLKVLAISGVVVSIKYLPRESFFLLGWLLINTIAVMATYHSPVSSLVPMYCVLYLCCALGCSVVLAWCVKATASELASV